VYYAHTLPGRPDSDWEPLLRHLSEVARAARDNGQRFGLGELAEIAGRVHDLGKYTPGFQARLNGGAKVDHSTAGAVWAHQHLPPRWGRLLAHVVAGHHAGLQDGLFDPEGRMESKRGSLAAVQRAAQADGLPLPTRVDAPPRLTALRGQEGFHIAFLTRMVFSCLIDADRTATACFVHGAPADPPQPSIQALEAAFQASTARREPRPGPVNDLRNDVLRTVLAKAAGPKGVFTLTVPTGGGKTLTSLAFALAHARENELDRVIVVIPFTSIIEQTAQVYRDALGPLGHAVLEHHSGFDMEHEAKWSDERVGPERLRLAMERWDSPIVVTTAVQFFESLFAARPSRCRKLPVRRGAERTAAQLRLLRRAVHCDATRLDGRARRGRLSGRVQGARRTRPARPGVVPGVAAGDGPRHRRPGRRRPGGPHGVERASLVHRQPARACTSAV
jgi:CRISPR-associated endonuclease/helicase Cas3